MTVGRPQHRCLLAPMVFCALVALLSSTFGAHAAPARHATAAQPVYGGTMRLGYSGAANSFDLAHAGGYDWYILNGTLFNGLYQFDRSGKPQLDLAAAPPTISADGKTWTFHIRKGIHYTNGMEVTADDFKYEITRVIDPRLKPGISWAETLNEVFQGWQDFVVGKAKEVTGIQVLDRYTIRFVLSQPLAILPYILAQSTDFAAPKALVSTETPAYWASHPVGTGPFMLQSWQKASQAVFVRNPHYFHAGKPYLDRVITYFNVAPSLIALKVERGDFDAFGLGFDIGPADYKQASTDPVYRHYLVPNAPTTVLDYLTVDVHDPWLNKLAIRQAMAMAINRPHLVKLLANKAFPAYQMYIPLDPQHDPELDTAGGVYPYNPQKAAALVKSSGYSGQAIVLHFRNNTGNDTALAPGVQQDLQQIGLNIHLLGRNSGGGISTPSLTGGQISFQDYGAAFPDGFDIYSNVMSCTQNAANGLTPAKHCDPMADDLTNKAQTMQLGSARDMQLRMAQRRQLASGAFIPLVFVKNIMMVSPTVGGFYFHPIFDTQFENYWVKH